MSICPFCYALQITRKKRMRMIYSHVLKNNNYISKNMFLPLKLGNIHNRNSLLPREGSYDSNGAFN